MEIWSTHCTSCPNLQPTCNQASILAEQEHLTILGCLQPVLLLLAILANIIWIALSRKPVHGGCKHFLTMKKFFAGLVGNMNYNIS